MLARSANTKILLASCLVGQVPALCAPYLETALALGMASPADFHDELARIYLRAVIERRRSANGAAAAGGAAGGGAPAPAPAGDHSASGGAGDVDGARTAARLCMRVGRRKSLPVTAGACQDVGLKWDAELVSTLTAADAVPRACHAD